MEKIAFIGSYDKADMLLYIGRILSIMKKRVLVVDSTSLQKTRYVIPTMQAEKQYITTHESVDVAIGFQTLGEIKKYQGLSNNENLDYDYVLLDIDSYRGYYYFEVKPDTTKFFVTSFDLYCLRRGLQVFRKVEESKEIIKVLFAKEILKEQDDYLNHLARGLKVKWDEDIIYFPFDNGDQNIIYSNQRTERISIKGLSNQYVEGIMYIIERMTGLSHGEVSKAEKILERV